MVGPGSDRNQNSDQNQNSGTKVNSQVKKQRVAAVALTINPIFKVSNQNMSY